MLPGVAERGITDRTIYRSADRSNVEDLDQFLDLGNLEANPTRLEPIPTIGWKPSLLSWRPSVLGKPGCDHAKLVSKTGRCFLAVGRQNGNV